MSPIYTKTSDLSTTNLKLKVLFFSKLGVMRQVVAPKKLKFMFILYGSSVQSVELCGIDGSKTTKRLAILSTF